jgi:hypothetical protein
MNLVAARTVNDRAGVCAMQAALVQFAWMEF